MSKPNVIVNLSRLVAASDGAGGAGWFGLFFARSASKCADVTVFVNSRTHQLVADFLRAEGATLVVTEDLSTPKAKSLIERAHVYVDPLNGLEPQEIPPFVYSIAVIHDLMFLDRPGFFTDQEIAARALNYGTSIARADLVLTVSEDQQKAIRDRYGKSNVEWIAQFPYFDINVPSDIRKSEQGRFLYYPGVQWNHKNHFRLIAAFLSLCERGLIDDDVSLVISGIRPVEANSMLHLEILGKSRFAHRVKEVPFLSPADYAGFMKSAMGIVFPTLYEGYGIPVVEAVANGVPILTSRTASYESLVGPPEFVRLIEDSLDIGSLARSLQDFIQNPPSGAPAPSTAPSASQFEARVREILLNALERPCRGENRGLSSGRTLPQPPRRAETLTLHLWAASADPSGLDRIRELVDSSAAWLSAVLYVSTDTLMGAQTSWRSAGRLRVTASDPLFGAQDATLVHELVMSSSRYNLVLSLEDSVALTENVLEPITALLSRANASNAIEAFRASASLLQWGEVAELLRGSVLDLDRLDIGFDTSLDGLRNDLQARLRVSTRHAAETFVICDPSLANLIGHHAGVARALARGAQSLGFRSGVAANRRASTNLLAPDARVRPSFDDYLYGGENSIAKFAADLEEVAGAELVTSTSFLTLFCATPAMLAGTVEFLLARPALLRPTILIRFDRDETRAPKAALEYADCFRLISQLGFDRHFRFFTESVGLQNYFEELSGRKFDLLFNSIDDTEARLKQIGVTRQRPTTNEFVIAYLGEARSEKGFQFLPFIVDYVITQYRGPAALRFKIQTGASGQNETQDIGAARVALAMMAKKDERIEALGFLDDAAYVGVLNAADALILPYKPSEYILRGSGIATEAAALAKPIVVSRGTDIQATYCDGGALVPDVQNELGFARAVCSLIENYPYWRDRAERFRADRPDLFGDEVNFVRRMVGAPAVEGVEQKWVLWISNNTRGEGSGVVYASQLKYLNSRGYRVIKLVIPYPNRECGVRRDFRFEDFFTTWEWQANFKDSPEFLQIANRFVEHGNSYDNFTAAWGQLEFPPMLAQWLRQIPFSFAVVNYAHHDAVLKTLGIAKATPRIVETHDIQAFQYAYQQGREVDSAEVAQELEALSAFDHIVSISASEAQTFASISAEKVTWCVPFVESPQRGALLKNTYDLLFVGSDHDANVVSIRWFVENVYKPVLFKEGLSLAIVGSVCQKLDQTQLTERVAYFGRVEDLHPYYQAAQIVVLPIIAGAGVPIKVLDAFARVKPFSLTRFPAAAIGLPPEFPTTDSAFDMAQDILDLYDDEAKRGERARLGQDFYLTQASEEHYFGKWDEIVRAATLGARPVSKTAPSAPAAAPPASVVAPKLTLQVGRSYNFADTPELVQSFTVGWYIPEPEGVWSGGDPAEIECSVIGDEIHGPELATEALELVVHCKVYGTQQSGTAKVTVTADGGQGAEWSFDDDQLQTRTVVLPVVMAEGLRVAKLRLHRIDARSPYDAGESADQRKLGLWIEGMTVERAIQRPATDQDAAIAIATEISSEAGG